MKDPSKSAFMSLIAAAATDSKLKPFPAASSLEDFQQQQQQQQHQIFLQHQFGHLISESSPPFSNGLSPLDYFSQTMASGANGSGPSFNSLLLSQQQQQRGILPQSSTGSSGFASVYHYLPYLLEQQQKQQQQQQGNNQINLHKSLPTTATPPLDLLTVASQLNRNFNGSVHVSPIGSGSNNKSLAAKTGKRSENNNNSNNSNNKNSNSNNNSTHRSSPYSSSSSPLSPIENGEETPAAANESQSPNVSPKSRD